MHQSLKESVLGISKVISGGKKAIMWLNLIRHNYKIIIMN